MGSNELQRFIDNKSLVALKKFTKLEAELKAAKQEYEEVIAKITEAMIAHVEAGGEPTLKGDWGYITLANRTNYKAESIADVPKKFTKQTLDTTKVKAEATLTGKLPKGVTESKTYYINKKFKEA